MKNIQLELPRIQELNEERLRAFGAEIKNAIDQWDKQFRKGIEYVSFSGHSGHYNAKEYAKAINEILQNPCGEYERIFPLIALQKGSNEGYRVCLYLQRQPIQTPVFSSQLIEVLSVKVWDRTTQNELYCFLEELLCW